MQGPQQTEQIEFRCDHCGFELYRPIGRLSVSTLGLYEDGRFPGRCLLALNEHAEHFEDLPGLLLQQLGEDAQKASRAIRKATDANRVNLAILGNVEPHLHIHLVPRGGVSDPSPGQSPWSCAGEEVVLEPGLARKLVSAISREL